MKIRLRGTDDSVMASGRMGQWRRCEGVVRPFIGCLVLVAIGVIVLAPFAGRSAAPVLQIGPFTNYAGKTYIALLITNATATNIYEIDTRPALIDSFPWV